MSDRQKLDSIERVLLAYDLGIYEDDHEVLQHIRNVVEENEVIDWKGKPNEYNDDGVLMDMDVGDWVVTHSGDVREIVAHDMWDLKGEDIARYATQEEVAHYLKPE